MRKIYSLVLMTAMLLVGTNVWATLHTSVNAGVDEVSFQIIPNGQLMYGTLLEAIAAAPHGDADNYGDSVVITLLRDVEISSQSVNIYAKESEKGKVIRLDLGTHKLSSPVAGFSTISLFKGKLTIAGSDNGTKHGQIISEQSKGGEPYKAAAINVFGHYDDQSEDWSVLVIEGPVEVSGTARGIHIYPFTKATLSEVGSSVSDNTKAFPMKKNSSNPSLYPDSIDYQSNKSIAEYVPQGKTAADYTNHAFGVRIEVLAGAQVHGGRYGMQITGGIRDSVELSNLSARKNPYIHIHHNALVTANADDKCAAIYSSGVGIWLIEGTLRGATGLYAKSGKVTIKDATIESNSTTYVATTGTDGRTTSGINGKGSAIIIEGTQGTAYAGGVDMVITGESEITSTAGYALEAQNFNPSQDDNVQSIVIESGDITGGDAGCIQMDVTISEDVIENGGIQGGNYNDDITTLLGENTGVITPVVDEQGNTSYTVSTKDPGETWLTDLLTATQTDMVKVSANVTLADLPGGTKTLTAKYIAVQAGATVTIPDGYTLHAGEIVMGAPTAVIDLQAGGVLVIDSLDGIVSNSASSIKIGTQEGKPALLLMNPNTRSNRNPKATVDFLSKSWRTSNTEKVYQFFGIPVNDLTSFVSSSSSYQTAVYRLGSLTPIGIMTDGTLANVAGLNAPYNIYYMLSTNDQDNKMTYTMTGNLLGNTNPTVNVETKWSPLANSYTGKINIPVLLTKLTELSATTGIEPTVYAYRVVGAQKIAWDAVNIILSGFDELDPMQPLMLMNRGAATTIDLNYNDLVWNPIYGSSPAPARIVAQENMTKAIMRVTAENGMYDKVAVAQSEDFTSDYEAGYDAEKYMNEGLNIYVTDNVRLNVLASDNINHTFIGFQCEEAGTYTLNFEKLQGENLILIDLATGARIAMVEGVEYQFYADANEANDYRFEVITIANMPTDVEVVENGSISNIGAVYTILGQYVGTMVDWQTLPSGIYVVDGEKRVK